MALFEVTAITLPGAKPEDAKNEILYKMTTGTKDGKLGQIPVGLIIVIGRAYYSSRTGEINA